MSTFDIAVAGVIILSGVFAFARGFVKELLSIASWLGATFAALYGLPYLRPVAQRFLPSGPIADAVAAIVIFVVALLVLSILTSSLARRVKASSLSAIDRTFGLIFGLLRGVLLVCVAYLALSWVVPPSGDQPIWLADSKTLPLLADGAQWLQQFVPGHLRRRATTAFSNPDLEVEKAIRAYRTPANPANPAAPPRYTPQEQHDLNRLIQQQEGGK